MNLRISSPFARAPRVTAFALACVLSTAFSASLDAAGPQEAPKVAAKTAGSTAEPGRVFRIGFHLWKPGKIYDEAMAGILDGLQTAGVPFEQVILDADLGTKRAAENLRKMDEMGLDLIYSLSSAGTQIAKGLNLKTPVVATVINHPASLELDPATSQTGTMLTGTSYYVDAKKQLGLYVKLFPGAKSVGMIFDTKNPAGALAEEPFMRQACRAMGLTFVSKGVTEVAALAGAAQALVEAKVDLIVIPTNTLVYENMAPILEVTNRHRVPVVAMNKQGVENGALAGLFADTYNLGRQAAVMGQRILEDGANPSDLAFEYIEQPDTILNMSSATALGLEFPPDVLGSAAIVLQ